MKRFEHVLVLTGDHGKPDPTKHGGTYGELDRGYHLAMKQALATLDHYRFEFLSDHDRFLDQMLSQPPEFVLNLCDTGYRNVPTRELHVPAYLELLDIPYSGAPPAAMVICYDKAIVRMVAQSLGVAVPAEWFLAPEDDPRQLDLGFPLLIKPNTADGSVGIGRDAVVHDLDAALDCLERVRARLPGQAMLLQEYLPGAEYGLGLIGNPEGGFLALPPLEVDFSALPAGLPPIQSFEAKTDPDSPYFRELRLRRADLPKQVLGRMRRDAEALFRRLQLRDYARFDFRVAADGGMRLMEVNPNPAWDPDAKFAAMTRFAGETYAKMFEWLLEATQVRLAGGGGDRVGC